MRKPACLAILGISVVVAAASLGISLTRYLGLRMYTPKRAVQTAETPSAIDVSPSPPEQWTNLFAPGDGMKLASRLPAPNGKTASQRPRTHFILVGTIVSSTPSARRAILWTDGMKEPKAFREKEEIEPGAVLASVERDKVWIKRDDGREKLEILPVGTRGRPMAAQSVSAALPAVGAAVSLPASPADASSLPWVAPASRTPLEKSPAIVRPGNPSEDDEEERLSVREKRMRGRGLRR